MCKAPRSCEDMNEQTHPPAVLMPPLLTPRPQQPAARQPIGRTPAAAAAPRADAARTPRAVAAGPVLLLKLHLLLASECRRPGSAHRGCCWWSLCCQTRRAVLCAHTNTKSRRKEGTVAAGESLINLCCVGAGCRPQALLFTPARTSSGQAVCLLYARSATPPVDTAATQTHTHAAHCTSKSHSFTTKK